MRRSIARQRASDALGQPRRAGPVGQLGGGAEARWGGTHDEDAVARGGAWLVGTLPTRREVVDGMASQPTDLDRLLDRVEDTGPGISL